MAKKPRSTEPEQHHDSVADFIVTDPKDASRSVRFGDLPIKSQLRMVAKAVNELLSDSGALSAKDQADKSEAEIATIRAERREKRWNSLLTGEFSVAGARGPRPSSLDKIVWEVALERMRTLWAKHPKVIAEKIPFPKKKEEQLPHFERFMAKYGDDVRAEAQRRMDSRGDAVADETLDELFN